MTNRINITGSINDPARRIINDATQAEMEAASITNKSVTPGRTQYHPGVCKLWGNVDRSAGTPSLNSPSYNITSVTDDGVGQTIVTIATDMSSVVYVPGAQTIKDALNSTSVVHT